jgi:hypothetical protein
VLTDKTTKKQFNEISWSFAKGKGMLLKFPKEFEGTEENLRITTPQGNSFVGTLTFTKELTDSPENVVTTLILITHIKGERIMIAKKIQGINWNVKFRDNDLVHKPSP